jgi:hypothetical protein
MHIDSLPYEDRERFAFVSLDPRADLFGKLADAEDLQNDILDDVSSHINEALAQVPEEDFMDDILDSLQALLKTMRKSAARDDLGGIIGQFELRQADYRRDFTELGDNLAKARDLLEGSSK